ncbi:response regulator [Mariniblastus sp.]|nr:response regulator [Mariniblastus sp.]
MSKIVLDVGQCNPDHSSISGLLKQHFDDVTVQRVHAHDEAIAKAKELQPALVLINRLYDANGDEGMETLAALKADDATAKIPVMIVSNYADAQEAAVAAGAVQGFGKSALNAPETTALLSEHLGSTK